MPFDQSRTAGVCPVCKGPANIVDTFLTFGVNCSCCGDFQVDRATIDDVGLPFTDPKAQALARYIIKKMQAPGTRPALTTDFFRSLHDRTLPTPTERSDNLLIWLAEQADGRLGNPIEIKRGDPGLYTIIGVIGELDIDWIVDSLQAQGLVLSDRSGSSYYGTLTAQGWQRVEELKRAHVSSSYAFFARKFENQELDEVFNKCLRLAVKQTGYELRPATQRAGLVELSNRG